MSISIAILTIHCVLPFCTSLKQKRSKIKPIFTRLHREFNISVAEVDHLDSLGSSIISCVVISNSPDHSRQVLQNTLNFISAHFQDIQIVEETLEFV